jgi:hypothetical protein
MQKQTLDAKQLRTLIEKAGVGDSFSKKATNVATRTYCSEPSMWRYLRQGTSPRQPPRFLLQLAYQYQILERPEDSGAALFL